MSLAFALAGMLKRSGMLDAESMDNAFEAALSSVETGFSADDRSAALARQLLDLMGAQLAAHVKPLGLPPESGEPRASPHSASDGPGRSHDRRVGNAEERSGQAQDTEIAAASIAGLLQIGVRGAKPRR